MFVSVEVFYRAYPNISSRPIYFRRFNALWCKKVNFLESWARVVRKYLYSTSPKKLSSTFPFFSSIIAAGISRRKNVGWWSWVKKKEDKREKIEKWSRQRWRRFSTVHSLNGWVLFIQKGMHCFKCFHAVSDASGFTKRVDVFRFNSRPFSTQRSPIAVSTEKSHKDKKTNFRDRVRKFPRGIFFVRPEWKLGENAEGKNKSKEIITPSSDK